MRRTADVRPAPRHLARRARPARRMARRSRPGGAAGLRAARPRLPLALRDALQLRADVGPSGRLDLVGPLRAGAALRHDGLRPRRARPRGRRRHLLRRRPQGARPLRACGRCATRSSRIAAPRLLPAERARTSSASRTCSASAATRPTPRRSSGSFGSKALDGHPTPATPFVRAGHRRLGRRPRRRRWASRWRRADCVRRAARRACTSSKARAA